MVTHVINITILIRKKSVSSRLVEDSVECDLVASGGFRIRFGIVFCSKDRFLVNPKDNYVFLDIN